MEQKRGRGSFFLDSFTSISKILVKELLQVGLEPTTLALRCDKHIQNDISTTLYQLSYWSKAPKSKCLLRESNARPSVSIKAWLTGHTPLLEVSLHKRDSRAYHRNTRQMHYHYAKEAVPFSSDPCGPMLKRLWVLFENPKAPGGDRTHGLPLSVQSKTLEGGRVIHCATGAEDSTGEMT